VGNVWGSMCVFSVHVCLGNTHIHPPLHRAMGYLAKSLMTSPPPPEAIEVINNLVQLLLQLLSTNMSVYKMVASLIVSFWIADSTEV